MDTGLRGRGRCRGRGRVGVRVRGRRIPELLLFWRRRMDYPNGLLPWGSVLFTLHQQQRSINLCVPFSRPQDLSSSSIIINLSINSIVLVGHCEPERRRRRRMHQLLGLDLDLGLGFQENEIRNQT